MSQQSPQGPGGALPPYAQPSQAAVQPYGHAQPVYAPPGAYPQAPPRRQTKTLAITALCIAIPAAILRFLPFVGMLLIPVVVITLILAIVALSLKLPGKGMSITALVVSIVGLVLPFITTFLSIGLFLSAVIEGSAGA